MVSLFHFSVFMEIVKTFSYLCRKFGLFIIASRLSPVRSRGQTHLWEHPVYGSDTKISYTVRYLNTKSIKSFVVVFNITVTCFMHLPHIYFSLNYYDKQELNRHKYLN